MNKAVRKILDTQFVDGEYKMRMIHQWSRTLLQDKGFKILEIL